MIKYTVIELETQAKASSFFKVISQTPNVLYIIKSQRAAFAQHKGVETSPPKDVQKQDISIRHTSSTTLKTAE